MRGKLSFARRFFIHHRWGAHGVVDVLESPHWPKVREAFSCLADPEEGVHIALTNYLIMKLWGMALAQPDTLEAGFFELLRRLGAGLYVAGVLAHAHPGPLGVDHVVAALAFSDVVYRVNAPEAPRLSASAQARPVSSTGRLGDLRRWVTHATGA